MIKPIKQYWYAELKSKDGFALARFEDEESRDAFVGHVTVEELQAKHFWVRSSESYLRHKYDLTEFENANEQMQHNGFTVDVIRPIVR